jgi:hypothetical protein
MGNKSVVRHEEKFEQRKRNQYEKEETNFKDEETKTLPPSGPPPPEKKTLSYLKSTTTFKNKIIKVGELLYPLFYIQFVKKIEIYNLEEKKKICEIEMDTEINEAFSMGNNILFLSAKEEWSIFDLDKNISNGKLETRPQRISYFFWNCEIQHIPNSNKFVYLTKDQDFHVVDYKNNSESFISNNRFQTNDFMFFNEDKYIVRYSENVFIFEFGNQIFTYSASESIVWLMNKIQILNEDFIILLSNGFHYYHLDQIKRVLVMDFKFLTMLSENVFLKMNTRNKLEIFGVGLDSKVKSIKILQMESDGSLDQVILASNGELISWDQFNVRHWDTSQFVKSISIESHFVNSFKNLKLIDLNFFFH